ncbi:MAG: hypothetical protein AMXMBFR58_28730 [Phycisphaerae bacterium]
MLLTSAVFGAIAPCAPAGPVSTPWGSTTGSSAVAAAGVAGRYATADAATDAVTIRNIDESVVRTISRAEINSLLPWMNLDASGDGPGAIAFSDSGRLLFIAVHDAAPATDGGASDAILRYDVLTDSLGVCYRLELFSSDVPTYGSLLHYKGRLYVGVPGGVRVFRAQMNDPTLAPLFTSPLTPTVMATGLAIDRTQSTLYVASGSTISRAPVTTANSLTWTTVGTVGDVRSLAFSTHYGGPSNAGLYALASDGSTTTNWFIPLDQARGTAAFSPTVYQSAASEWRDVVATADGGLLVAMPTETRSVRDSTDTRLSFAAWRGNEFAQVVNFAKSLVTTGPGAGGGPAGWVIDGDVQIGWSRFHPVTPDAAAWAVLLLIASDYVSPDPAALPTVRSILTRYAGLAPDGIGPSRSADGIFRHWIDPYTGGVKSGWDPEFATMSTMKIVLAAARARSYWPADATIAAAAEAIICGVTNHDAYFFAPSYPMALRGNAGGGGTFFAGGFHEGILFAEQAGAYGTSTGPDAWSHWQTRSSFPSATLVTGRPTAAHTAGSFLPAFITMYANLLVRDFRHDTAWAGHTHNLRLSHAAWTDDNGPRYNTVFAAGTTKGEWGGYHADSLSDHPGDVTTFTSLEAMSSGTGVGASAGPQTADAVGAYNAYRMGARQTFLGGASLLYRRSNVDPSYQPDSAGLPDVAVGGLGLAELLKPGTADAVLTGFYPSCTDCPADFDGSGFVDIEDYTSFVLAFEAGTDDADFDRSGFVDIEDFTGFVLAFEAGC